MLSLSSSKLLSSLGSFTSKIMERCCIQCHDYLQECKQSLDAIEGALKTFNVDEMTRIFNEELTSMNFETHDGRCALILSIKEGNKVPFLTLLQSDGCDVNKVLSTQETALFCCSFLQFT